MITLKILFKNETKYTKEIYKKFVDFHSNKYNTKYNMYTIIIVFLILFCIVLQVSYRYYLIAFLTCIIFAIFCLYRFLHPLSIVKKELEGEIIQKEKSFTFKFYDKYFIISEKKDLNIVKYYKLKKAFETKDFFYLYLDKSHAFLLNKKNFIIGNPEDFSRFLKKKCFLRFKKVESKTKK